MGALVTDAFEGLGVGLIDGGGVVVVLVVVVALLVVVVVVVVTAVVVIDPPEVGLGPQSHKGGLLLHGQYCE